MEVIVQKFGGTSLRDETGRKSAVKHITAAVSAHDKVVAVVSAMGRKGDPYATDSLLDLIAAPKVLVTNREQDVLLSCGETISAVVMSHLLNAAGVRATMLSASQAGIVTTADYGNARIIDIQTDRLWTALKEHDIVVVPGFQGMSKYGDVTTLGRGGSDTTAAALGAALRARSIDIFTDVEGMMTADPNIVKKARPLAVVTYNEVSNMANLGAKVIHPRAVEIAMQANVPLRIRSTYSENAGTLVTSTSETKRFQIHDRVITGIAYVDDITQIKVLDKKGYSQLQSKVFKAMAEHGISVDFINMNPNGVTYTVTKEMTDKALRVLKGMGYEPIVEKDCAKVSLVGAGMTGVPGVTAKIVTTLTEKGIQILQSADSHTTIWVLIKRKDLESAINALHDTFSLER